MNPAPREGTVFVPGHGDVGNAEDVAAFRGYLVDLRAMVAGSLRAGKSGDELVAAVTPQLSEKYGQWGIFEHFAKRNILDVAAELRGDKVIPRPAKTARLPLFRVEVCHRLVVVHNSSTDGRLPRGKRKKA